MGRSRLDCLNIPLVSFGSKAVPVNIKGIHASRSVLAVEVRGEVAVVARKALTVLVCPYSCYTHGYHIVERLQQYTWQNTCHFMLI